MDTSIIHELEMDKLTPLNTKIDVDRDFKDDYDSYLMNYSEND